jgi:hypothetical protein
MSDSNVYRGALNTMSALLIISLILFNYLAVDRELLRASSGELLRLAWERVFDPSLDKYDYITGVCIGESRLYLLGLTQFNGSQTTFIYAFDLSSGVVVESVEVDQSLGAAGLYDCVEVDGNLYVAGTNKTALILILDSTLELINVVKTDFFPYRDEALSLAVLGDNLYSLIYSYAELSDAEDHHREEEYIKHGVDCELHQELSIRDSIEAHIYNNQPHYRGFMGFGSSDL